MGLQQIRNGLHALFVTVGLSLTVYIAASAFGYVKNSSVHYSIFILGSCIMASLLALRDLSDERINNNQKSFFYLRSAVTVIAAIGSVFSMGYITLHAIELERTQPFFNDTDLVIGWIMMISILALTLIHWGWLLTSVIALAILYFFVGHTFTNPLFMTPKYDHGFIMNYIGLGTNQGFYYLAQIASDQIYFLIIYAAVLLGVGMLNMVLEIGKVTGRHLPGGAAGPAVLGSGIVSSIMGQAVSNVVLTGRLTIPMMKRYGYSASMAGSIEATASTAGQIMPPVMGLAAFIIASFVNRPYIEVALMALIPGLLYIVGVSFSVGIFARKHRLPRLKEKVESEMIWRLLPTFLVSFGIVLWLLLGYRSPAIAGLWGIISALGMSWLQGKYRPSYASLKAALNDGLFLVSIMSLLLIAIGPLGQVMITTNLSGKLGAMLVHYLPDTQILLLLGTMVVSLILGMGMPTPVAYIIVALALVPFMQQIGIPQLQAHFFVFYFAVFSTLTPPVAVSVLAAAKLSGAKFSETAVDSMKIACTTFIIPFAFVFRPELMSFPDVTAVTLATAVLILLMQLTISAANYGYFLKDLVIVERILLWTAFVSLFAYLAELGDLWLWLGIGIVALQFAYGMLRRFQDRGIRLN
ncbi:MAG: hypothetical protein CL389_04365 [Acidiferrobacteraceae bacterium]|jgi:TRAP transporter 4TM/12TM fusion protein|nr:hypothetical protein [Acidiferrobacteraceae bacterium]MDP6413272.1 TRAP transporter fused permease subunit [Arenicellales bacterium]MDP6551119.1 TRAP transporter fused permease subunit [Arenicellales bacterium]|tara:strand:- start:2342 stop:4255 length:1914 start_codon:yes stop_codon:yes gene_type:complete